MRFAGQGYEINVTLPSGRYRKPDIARLRQRFFDAYATTYGDRSSNEEASVEIVHYRVTASCPGPALALRSIALGDEDPQGALKGYRRVYFPESRGFARTPVFDRDRLEAGILTRPLDRCLVLAPATAQEMCDLTRLALDLADKYRNPAFILVDDKGNDFFAETLRPITSIPVGPPRQ